MTNQLFRDYLDRREEPAVEDECPCYWCATYDPPPPTDQRAHALRFKQHRGTGPTPEPLRTRGRNNHYRTKG